MLRLQPFELLFPKDLSEAASLLSVHKSDYMICAGGTDLLPNMKHELHEPSVVIHLAHVGELSGISEDEASVSIGAMTTLQTLESSKVIQEHFPSLADAARHVASPQIRNMGTIGGNICLDTRCLFYNQSHFWREAIGFCLKKCGDTCHVTKTGKKCVAASSNDTATALISLGASVETLSSEGRRTISMSEFYVANGEKNNCLNPGEMVVKIQIPKSARDVKRFQGFSKLRNRNAIDFPMLSIAVCIDVKGDHIIEEARLTVNALAAKPKPIQTKWLIGKKLDSEVAKEAGAFAQARCIPLINICDDPVWRKEMVAVYVERAITSAISQEA